MTLNEIHENEWYDFYFQNKGVCPYCGFNLIPHWGCFNFTCSFSVASSKLNPQREKEFEKASGEVKYQIAKKHARIQKWLEHQGTTIVVEKKYKKI